MKQTIDQLRQELKHKEERHKLHGKLYRMYKKKTKQDADEIGLLSFQIKQAEIDGLKRFDPETYMIEE